MSTNCLIGSGLLVWMLALATGPAAGSARAAEAALPAGHPAVPAGDRRSAPPSQPGGFSGQVLETMDAGRYTYVQIETGSQKVWAAAPQFEVKVGDTVSFGVGVPMANYHSQVLNRDFDMVRFVGRISVGANQPAASGAAGKLPDGHPDISGRSNPAAVDLSGVQKAPDGMTVGEILAGKTALAGKQVKVRGKVVSFTAQVMGKNWVHIRDGTGADSDNDLTVTTEASAEVGDTVLVTGTVVTDQDFGYDYKYAVLIKDAQVLVE